MAVERKPRRIGAETSETRVLMLDVTEQVILADGYAAVSSRRIAKEAGVTPALVHYYFPSLDDLFLAVLHRRAQEQLERVERALASPQPLQALWKASRDKAGTGLLLELMALANHRKVIRSELAEQAERYRKALIEGISAHLEACGLDLEAFPPVAILTVLSGVARSLVLEESLGMSTGLPETEQLIERMIQVLEG